MATLLQSSPEVTPCRDRGAVSPLREPVVIISCRVKYLLRRLVEWAHRDAPSRRIATRSHVSAGRRLHSTFTVPSTVLSELFCLSTTTLALLRG